MLNVSSRALALGAAAIAALALGAALATERWGGIVPCALCLVERWPYRIAIVFGLAAATLPPRRARGMLALFALTMLTGAVLAAVHVGVEQHWWPSPLPECAAPHITGHSLAERLAEMPDRPAKPCDAPTFLIPGLPISMAAMNFIASLGFFIVILGYLVRERGKMR